MARCSDTPTDKDVDYLEKPPDSEQFTWAKDYTYDADGNITRIGSTASGYDEFGFDGVGRLHGRHALRGALARLHGASQRR